MLVKPAGESNSFSSFGRVIDLKNRQSSTPKRKPQSEHRPKPKMTKGHIMPQQNTTAFTSVSREKRGNFRFPIRLCKHELKYRPNYFVGADRKPSWSMSKAQRTPRDRYVDYEICQRNPLFRRTRRTSRSNVEDMAGMVDDPEKKIMGSTMATSKGFATARSRMETSKKIMNKTWTDQFNYSIVDEKELSQVGQFFKTKIEKPMKLDKTALMNIEIEQRQAHDKRKLLGDVYINMKQKQGRKPNINHEQYLQERHFSNFSLSLDVKQHVHDFESSVPRMPPKPNESPIYDLLAINLDKIREDTKRGNVKLQTFRDQVRTRYDRVGQLPTTRVDYDYDMTKLGHLIAGKAHRFDEYKNRPEDLFPIVDPAIKRDSDYVMTEELKKELVSTRTNPFC